MSELLNRLSGGDLRSIGDADAVVAIIGDDQDRFDEVFQGFYSDDPVLRMRVSDVIEKSARHYSALLNKHTAAIVERLPVWDEQQEVKIPLALMLGYLTLSKAQLPIVKKYLHKWLPDTRSRIVQVNCMHSLVDLGLKHGEPEKELIAMVHEQMDKGSAAVKARGRKLLKKLLK